MLNPPSCSQTPRRLCSITNNTWEGSGGSTRWQAGALPAWNAAQFPGRPRPTREAGFLDHLLMGRADTKHSTRMPWASALCQLIYVFFMEENHSILILAAG